MKYFSKAFSFFGIMAFLACNTGNKNSTSEGSASHKEFASFEDSFLDAYWKQYPNLSISVGYGKYYDSLVIPDSTAFANNVAFSNAWLDSLNHLKLSQLNENDKISFEIIKHQLQSDQWYASEFKPQEWDASMYNISGACDYILNQPYAPLEERLKILSKYLSHTDVFYQTALKNLHKPTKEHIELAIRQNQAGIGLFGAALTDSIKAAALSETERNVLHQNIDKAVAAMKGYVHALQAIVANKSYDYRSYRIGAQLFAEKFKHDLATDLSPEQVYAEAKAKKQFYHQHMYVMADSVWSKYYPTEAKPKDSLALIQMVLNKIQLHHASPDNFFAVLSQQVHDLKKFIVDKDLFDFDTSATPIVVRYMPEYARGITIASAEFIPPYQKKGTTYYNIEDLRLYPPAKAESALREANDYASQILSIHEAVPGHCLQGIYNNKKSPDVLRSVFQNGAMIEGWAVYCEAMMVENGWGNHAPEIELALGVWRLRELANVIIDYDIQCKGAEKEQIVNFLSKECFQTDDQVQEKYKRATLSQVQLCSYFTGATAIQSLRDEYQKKMGDKYSLKDFHEKFLSYGSSPVKYIRERMLQ